MGRLFITIVGALGQWERETIGERVHLGQAQMVREGKYSPPYGYTLRDEMVSAFLICTTQETESAGL